MPARSAAWTATASRSATSCCQTAAFSGSVSSRSFSEETAFTFSAAAFASSAFFRQNVSFSNWVRLFPVQHCTSFSTSSSVSGRGISTAGDTLNSHCRNALRPMI